MNKNKKILVALSGGVDSSVAALLLKKQDYDVIGVFLKFWSPSFEGKQKYFADNTCEGKNTCCDWQSLQSARDVCEKLDIPLYVFDVSKEFKKQVVDYFIDTYKKGETPNPCVVCNKTIKFGWLLDKAKKLGCDYLATGHYAQTRIYTDKTQNYAEINTDQCGIIRCHPEEAQATEGSIEISKPVSTVGGRDRNDIISSDEYRVTSNYHLLIPKDIKKDQTYFLWQLSQKQLSNILFPLGGLTKNQVREIAKKNKLPVYNKTESQDVCFLGGLSVEQFVKRFSKNKNHKKCKIVDIKGNVLAYGKELVGYNVGQRVGKVNLDMKKYYKKINPQRLPAIFVIKLDMKNNFLIVGEKQDLYKKIVYAQSFHAMSLIKINNISSCIAKIRYGAEAVRCKVVIENKLLKIRFEKPVYAPCSGQSIVFYDKDMLLGGAIIL